MVDVCNICSNNCIGVQGYNGKCCSVDHEWILGPHNPDDALEFIKNLSNKFDKEFKYEDVFINYEEGSKIFPNKHTWQKSENYPALRVNLESTRKFCTFYDENTRVCTVYDIRPKICQNYECSYLKEIKKKDLETQLT